MMTDPDVVLAALEKEFGPVPIPCVVFGECSSPAEWWLKHECGCDAVWSICSAHRLVYIRSHAISDLIRTPGCGSCHRKYNGVIWTEIAR